jgi:hypothetical protein
LKLEDEKMLSNFAFKFSLCHYKKELMTRDRGGKPRVPDIIKVGRRTATPSCPTS